MEQKKTKTAQKQKKHSVEKPINLSVEQSQAEVTPFSQASMFDQDMKKQQQKNEKYAKLKKQVALEENLDLKAQIQKDDSSIIDAEIVEEHLEEVQKYEKQKKSKKSKIINLLFLLANIVLVVVLIVGLLKSLNGQPLETVIASQGKRLWWLAGGLGVMFVVMLADACSLFMIIHKTTKKARPVLSYTTAITGRYYESITPLSAGAQPSQIVYMAKRGISPGIATSIPIIKMMIYNACYVFIALTFFIFVGPTLQATSTLNNLFLIIFKILAGIGLVISSVTTILIIVVGSSRVWGRSLARWCIRMGYKLRLVKNYRQSYDKLMTQVIEFQNSIAYLRKNIGLLIGLIVACAIQLLATASVPFFVTMAFSSVEFASTAEGFRYWLDTVMRFYIVFLAASYIPLPGGTGMTEVAFVAMFGSDLLMGTTNIVWGFLAWRILTYYLLIAQGIILIIVDAIVGASHKRKIQKQENTSLEVPKITAHTSQSLTKPSTKRKKKA